ncbi:MAG: DUF3782 domain-containing protein [bacterium]
MELNKIKEIIREELPKIMQTDEEIARFILRLSSQYYAGKQETEDRFDRMLNELKRDREEQSRTRKEQDRKWEEQNQKWWENQKALEEQSRKWEEKWAEEKKAQDQKWEEQERKWWENQKAIEERFQQTFQEIKAMNRKHDQTIEALGARWGLHSEASFRNALAGILGEFFQVKVLHIHEFDDTGEVFGHPDQVEMDLLIKNGLLIICEIKSSMSKGDMYIFDRKVKFYERLHDCKANRKIVISPMADDKAKIVADHLGIEVYSYAEDVKKD